MEPGANHTRSSCLLWISFCVIEVYFYLFKSCLSHSYFCFALLLRRMAAAALRAFASLPVSTAGAGTTHLAGWLIHVGRWRERLVTAPIPPKNCFKYNSVGVLTFIVCV